MCLINLTVYYDVRQTNVNTARKGIPLGTAIGFEAAKSDQRLPVLRTARRSPEPRGKIPHGRRGVRRSKRAQSVKPWPARTRPPIRGEHLGAGFRALHRPAPQVVPPAARRSPPSRRTIPAYPRRPPQSEPINPATAAKNTKLRFDVVYRRRDEVAPVLRTVGFLAHHAACAGAVYRRSCSIGL